MSSLDALLGKKVENTSTELCVIGANFKSLEGAYLEAYKSLINTPVSEGGQSAAVVASVLRNAGLRGGATTISNHRNKLCVCPIENEKETN